jgi:hypothetical protein
LDEDEAFGTFGTSNPPIAAVLPSPRPMFSGERRRRSLLVTVMRTMIVFLRFIGSCMGWSPGVASNDLSNSGHKLKAVFFRISDVVCIMD